MHDRVSPHACLLEPLHERLVVGDHRAGGQVLSRRILQDLPPVFGSALLQDGAEVGSDLLVPVVVTSARVLMKDLLLLK